MYVCVSHTGSLVKPSDYFCPTTLRYTCAIRTCLDFLNLGGYVYSIFLSVHLVSFFYLPGPARRLPPPL